MGRLILGGDKDWSVKVDEEKRKEHNLLEAKSMLEKLAGIDYQHLFDDEEINSSDDD